MQFPRQQGRRSGPSGAARRQHRRVSRGDRRRRQKGDVLVIDNGGRTDEGCIGDLVVGEAFMSGIAATICWGTHRDTAAIAAMGARVWSLGTCPNGPLGIAPARHDRAHGRQSRCGDRHPG